jgi:hypothetical protein
MWWQGRWRGELCCWHWTNCMCVGRRVCCIFSDIFSHVPGAGSLQRHAEGWDYICQDEQTLIETPSFN